MVLEPKEGFLEINGGKVHYIDFKGDGKATHFLHANGFCAGTYAPLFNLLCPKLHIIGSDIRGHGDSDKPSDPIKHWRIFSNDLKYTVENLLPQPAIGIGHSLGAVVTYITAALNPKMFKGIILIDPVIFAPKLLFYMGFMRLFGMKIPLSKGALRRRRIFKGKQEALQRFISGRGMFKTWSPEFIDAYLECALLKKDAETAILKCDPELESQIFDSVPLDIWSYAKHIECPVLAIRGEQSDTFRNDAGKRLIKKVSDCKLVTIPNAGHFVPMEQPSATAEAILNFTEKL